MLAWNLLYAISMPTQFCTIPKYHKVGMIPAPCKNRANVFIFLMTQIVIDIITLICYNDPKVLKFPISEFILLYDTFYS